MAMVLEFWEADGADGDGEALIVSHRCKLLDALAMAATARPARCVLATYTDTRKDEEYVTLWVKPGYSSTCITPHSQGVLNLWKEHI